jgi:hypothetical protein
LGAPGPAKARRDLCEKPLRQARRQLFGKLFESVDQGPGHAAQEKFRFHVTAGEGIAGQSQPFKDEPGAGGKGFDLLRMEQKMWPSVSGLN